MSTYIFHVSIFLRGSFLRKEDLQSRYLAAKLVICNVCALFVAPLATYGHNAVAVIFGNSSIVTNCFHFKRKYSERPTSLKYSSWNLVAVKRWFLSIGHYPTSSQTPYSNPYFQLHTTRIMK